MSMSISRIAQEIQQIHYLFVFVTHYHYRSSKSELPLIWSGALLKHLIWQQMNNV